MKPLLVGMLALSLASAASGTDILGISFDTGNLYRISTADAAMTLVGNAGMGGWGSLESAPDGQVFATSTGVSAALFRINPNTGAASAIGPLNVGFVFEGGLAFSPGGIAYAVNQGGADAASLFKVDLATGQGTLVGVIGGGAHDINGLGWRSDGLLIGLDRVSNSLLIIDPFTAASSVLRQLTPVLGGVGGMTLLSDSGYFCTAGPGGSIAGSNALYSFNAFTGDYQLVGGFYSTVTGTGISGLAMIPEPSSMILGALAGFAFILLHRRQRG